MEKATKAMHLNLDKDAHAVLMELAEVSGLPASHFVAHLVQSNVEELRRLTDTHRMILRKVARRIPGLLAA